MVNGLGEEALNLGGMEIHRDNAVRAAHLYAVCAYPAPYGNAGFVLLVGLCIAEIRNNCGYGICACAFERIYPEYQLHKSIVGLLAYGLNYVNVLIPDALVGAHIGAALGEYVGVGFARVGAKVVAHLIHKRSAGGAGEDPDLTVIGMTHC